METRRWTNPSQPQTLYMVTFLLYISAVFDVLLGSIFSIVGLLIVAGYVASGYGIANERRWGYYLALVIASFALLFTVVLPLVSHPTDLFDVRYLLAAVFPVALFALLVHPMSREYQKVWFH